MRSHAAPLFAYALNVSSQRFRAIAFEIRGRLYGPGDEVHGEICPHEFIYHSIVPIFYSAGNARCHHTRQKLQPPPRCCGRPSPPA